MSRQSKLIKHLKNGKSVTAVEITEKFGLKNPHDAIYKARNAGHCVYSNPNKKLNDGSVVYHIGTPSRYMISVVSRLLGANMFKGSH